MEVQAMVTPYCAHAGIERRYRYSARRWWITMPPPGTFTYGQ